MYQDDLSRNVSASWPWRGDEQHAAPRAQSHVRRLLRALWREPLTHFLALGIVIFIVSHAIEAHSKRYVITVSPGDVTRITNSYAQQYGNAPDASQLRRMLDNYVREEIYLREGVALGLDKDDEIVRRRIAQKFEFLQGDLAVPRDPSDAELKDWFASHKARFIAPARRSFDQLYFSADRRGDAAARALAEAALRATTSGQAPRAADDFPGPKTIAAVSQDDTQRIFGGPEFARAVFGTTPGRWVGPLHSGFGWHLIRVTDAAAPHQRSFDEARNDARNAWQQADRDARNDTIWRQLRGRYTVRVEGK